MIERIRVRRAALSVAGAVAGVTVAGMFGSTPSAAAAPSWTLVSSGWLRHEQVPSVARFGTELQVAWTQGPNSQLASAVVTGSGRVTARRTVRSAGPPPLAIGPSPAVFSVGDRRVIAFIDAQCDLFSSQSCPLGPDDQAGRIRFAESADGRTWSIVAGSLPGAGNPDFGIDAVSAGGVPVTVTSAWTEVGYMTGRPTEPAAERLPFHTQSTGPGVALAGVGYDPATKRVMAAWYSGSGIPGADGIMVQRIYPSPGPLRPAPLSSITTGSKAHSAFPGQRVDVISRPAAVGGGAYVAYLVGDPAPHTIALWRIGTTRPLLISAPAEVARVAVAAGTGGRLWVMWTDADGNKLHAVSTNRSATGFGKVVTVATPPSGPFPAVVAGDGSLGPLDVVVNTSDVSYMRIPLPLPER